ncbi:MAG: hypothetical protein Q8M16_14530 [Pirellulaceae bacterium]|nr:hypothetical protein [Pirellulaceae bacterium]
MFNWFNDRRFGLLTVRLILLMAIGMAMLPIQPSAEEIVGRDVTVLSRVPQSELQDPMVIYGFQAVVVLSCVLWLLNWLTPFSCWIAVLSFAGLSALRIENSTELCHSYSLLWQLMVVHSLWYSFYSSKLGASEATSRCYPAWVFWLCVFVLGWFHTLSGLGKWMAADPDWANGWNWADGVSLQLWLQAFGNPNSRLVQFLLQEVAVARVVQQAILVIELTAILAIFTPTLRRFVGLALVVYYGFFLHCFVDWQSLLGRMGLGAETVEMAGGSTFPLMSYAFFLFWVCWVFLVPDRVLGSWVQVQESQDD